MLEKRIQELEQLNQGLIQHARLRRGVNKRKGGTVEVDMTLEEESSDDIKAPPFPLQRLLVYLGFGLLIASIMSVAIVVGITQCLYREWDFIPLINRSSSARSSGAGSSVSITTTSSPTNAPFPQSVVFAVR